MSTQESLPGTPHHQELLRLITRFYAGDNRVRALVLFGSLGRGAGDTWSDLDLAVIVHDGAHVDVRSEIGRLAVALAEQGDPILMSEIGGETAYMVPESLCGIAVEYSELAKVSPYVLVGCTVLAGTLDLATIHAAAAANDGPLPELSLLLHRALWLALGASVTLQRGQFWQALTWLNPLRGVLFDIYAFSRGGRRSIQLFAETAGADLQAKFGSTLPAYTAGESKANTKAAAGALSAQLDLIEHYLSDLSSGRLQLSPGKRAMIARLRARQAALNT